MWVYTEYGQKLAEFFGNMDRKAGKPAMLGYEPVSGMTAKDWEKNGYIEWKEEQDGNESADS